MKKERKSAVKTAPQKKVDLLFAEYAASHQHPSNQLINWVCIPMMLFSILGLLWSVPFPHMGFLGRYNGFVNWASFFIAISGYYHYRLSPVLSYMMILLVFALSLLVVQFEKWEAVGGPALWLVCMATLILASVGLFIGQKIEGKANSFQQNVKFMLTSPIWMLKLILLKIALKSH